MFKYLKYRCPAHSGFYFIRTQLFAANTYIEINLTLDEDDEPPTLIFHSVEESATTPGWVDISGTLEMGALDPLCGLILANGQQTYSCDPIGEFNLSVPLDENGEITFFACRDEFLPHLIVGNVDYFKSLVVSPSYDEGGSSDISEAFGWAVDNPNRCD